MLFAELSLHIQYHIRLECSAGSRTGLLISHGGKDSDSLHYGSGGRQLHLYRDRRPIRRVLLPVLCPLSLADVPSESEYLRKGLVKYEFCNLIVHGRPARWAAIAGEWAHKPGRFWEFHDRLFETIFTGGNIYQHKELALDDLKGIAAAVGLDKDAFQREVGSAQEQYNRCQTDHDRCTAAGGRQQVCAVELTSCLSSNGLFAEFSNDQDRLRLPIDQLPPDEQTQAQRIGTPNRRTPL